MSERTAAQPGGTTRPDVWGHVAPGFDVVAEAFDVNLSCGEDLGAQFAVRRGDDVLVDIWGGSTRDGAAFPREALHPLFSVTKALTGVVIGILMEDGLIDLDAAVSHYWPAFGAEGKQGVTVAQLLAHQAGIPGVAEPVGLDELRDPRALAERFAGQRPMWRPGTAHGYHALSIGPLVGELVRRVAGSSVGTILARRVAEPLGLDLWIGAPDDALRRVQDNAEPLLTPGTGGAFARAAADEGTPTWRAFSNPPVTTGMFDDHRLLAVELPSANGVADARSLAALFAALVDPDEPVLRRATIDRMRRRVSFGEDQVLVGLPTRYGALFMLGGPIEPMLGPQCFGHNGVGGSLAFADPVSGVGVGYLVNRPQLGTNPFPRVTRLLEALRIALSEGQ